MSSPSAERSGLIRALAVLCETPGLSHPAIAAALDIEAPTAVEHTELFIHQLPPYASIYLDPQGKIGGEARDRIAGFWRAVGIVPPAEPDHLASLLGLWATLLDAAADDIDLPGHLLIEHAQRALVWEHLVSWLPPYLSKVAAIAPNPYVAWSMLLRDTVIRALPPEAETGALPAHLAAERQPVEDAGDLVPYLLTPIRSGIILTRADLHRAAGELNLGIRIGERAFALMSLLNQDRMAVVGWVAAEARRQAGELRSATWHRSLANAWGSRTAETASLLGDLTHSQETSPAP